MQITDAERNRFLSRWTVGISPDVCHEWPGKRCPNGYGLVGFHRKRRLAHRVAYLIANGELPAGSLVLHRCDNPPCCNPDHLFLGTHADNTRDAVRKGRWSVPKITPEVARQIAAVGRSGMSAKAASKQFGVSYDTARKILSGATWSKVTREQPAGAT